MTWVCDIPGADAATSAWHFALHVGLAAFVVGAGMLFLYLAVIAYRRPVESIQGGPPPLRKGDEIRLRPEDGLRATRRMDG